MKKTLSVIFAALMLFLVGCSAELSEEDYFAKLMENYRAYNTEVISIATAISDGDNFNKDEVKASAVKAENALAEIEKLNPPAIYSAQHQSICEEMQTEKNWVSVAKKMGEQGLTNELLEEMASYGSESEFHSQIFATVKRMREDGVEYNFDI